MPITGGINWPPSEEADSIAAAVAGGMLEAIIAGIVAEPMVMALAAPLPLTMPTHIEPTTADCGMACAERKATRLVARSSDSMQPKPRSRLSTSRNEPTVVSAICGRREKMPVATSTLLAVMRRSQVRPGMIEHAGHPVAVDGVENEHDVQDEQRHVALARIFHDQQRHHAAHDQVGGVPRAGALEAERHVFGVHVVGAVERKCAVGECDQIIRDRRQGRIEVVVAQRLQREQDEDDGNERHGEQRGPADAGPVVPENDQEKRDRHRVIEVVEDDWRPFGNAYRSCRTYGCSDECSK